MAYDLETATCGSDLTHSALLGEKKPLSVKLNSLFALPFCQTCFQNIMPGEMSRIQAVAWNSDLQRVVLEVPDESGKGTQDSEICTWRQLLTELAENSISDPTINSHELRAPLAAEVGQGFSSLIY